MKTNIKIKFSILFGLLITTKAFGKNLIADILVDRKRPNTAYVVESSLPSAGDYKLKLQDLAGEQGLEIQKLNPSNTITVNKLLAQQDAQDLASMIQEYTGQSTRVTVVKIKNMKSSTQEGFTSTRNSK